MSVASVQQTTVRNRLLRQLSPADFALLQPALRPMATQLRQVMIAPETPIRELFFPEDGFVSIVTAGPGSRAEVGVIGKEGLVGGAPVLLGGDRTPYEHFVQGPGTVLAVAAEALNAAIDRSPSLHRLLLRGIQVQLVQTAHTAFVNATCQIETRLARWMLMCHDRTEGDEFAITHEFLALMLGVQRTTVTLALQSLESHGWVRARRGRIIVLDRAGLERGAGEAYGVPEAEFERLIGNA